MLYFYNYDIISDLAKAVGELKLINIYRDSYNTRSFLSEKLENHQIQRIEEYIELYSKINIIIKTFKKNNTFSFFY